MNPPPGCAFHARCPYVEPRCRVEAPRLQEVAPGHWVSCHRHEVTA
jgi:peptide/nickel transport system ATP-binding protein